MQFIDRGLMQRPVVAAPVSTQGVIYPMEATVPPTASIGYAFAYPAFAPAVTYPSTAHGAAGYPASCAVGSVIPASLLRAAVPQSMVARIPQAQPCECAVMNDRMLLIEPVTGTVVADVTP